MSIFVKSPLNFTGGKFKILEQIAPVLNPENRTFVDLFAGGLNVTVNIDADKIIVNEKLSCLVDLYRFMYNSKPEDFIIRLEERIIELGLTLTCRSSYEAYGSNSKIGLAHINKDPLKKLKSRFNVFENYNPIDFYILVIYSFNNQIRFNRNGYFNLPANKRDFNSALRARLIDFIVRLRQKHIEFRDEDFENIEIISDSFIYADPPYLISTATYNENNNWTAIDDRRLFKYLDAANRKGVQFALSNFMIHNGNENRDLMEWSKRYNVINIRSNYFNSSYQKSRSRTEYETVEVLITNY